MRVSYAIVAGAAAAVAGAVAARYFGSSARLALLAGFVIAYAVLSILVRREERALARDLANLSSQDQEELLGQLDAKDRARVRKDMNREAE